jgi:hypothetical protein
MEFPIKLTKDENYQVLPHKKCLVNFTSHSDFTLSQIPEDWTIRQVDPDADRRKSAAEVSGEARYKAVKIDQKVTTRRISPEEFAKALGAEIVDPSEYVRIPSGLPGHPVILRKVKGPGGKA